MTQNDNLRNYIGDLETNPDIDVVFKHIYDLMLANGGEGSGLNADMVDGYHASDFAPASLADDLENCIHEIYIEGNDIPYTGYSTLITLYTKYITHQNRADQDINLKKFLDDLEDLVAANTSRMDRLFDLTAFLQQGDVAGKLEKIVQNNIVVDDDGQYYLNSDMVNGLSFILVTQDDYDTKYSTEEKEDPHNVFIINNDLDTDVNNGRYAPPSVLRSGLNLTFKIFSNPETQAVMFSIDGKDIDNPNKVWYHAFDMIGDSKNEGILYPGWFEDIKDVIFNPENDEELRNQDNYPFILNDEYNLDNINNAIQKIKVGESTSSLPTNHILDITTLINNYIDSAVASATSSLANTISNTYLKKADYGFNGYSATDFQVISNLDDTAYTLDPETQEASSSRYPSSKLVKDGMDSLDQRVSANEGNISSMQNYDRPIAMTKPTSQADGNPNTFTSYDLGPYFIRLNNYFIKDKNGNTVKRRETNGKVYNKKTNTTVYKQSEQGGSFTPSTILKLDLDENGTNVGVSLTKRNGIAQLRMYFDNMWLYRSKTGYEEINGTSNSAPSSYFEANVAIFEFPPGYYPAVAGYVPILNKVPDNPVVWKHGHDFIERVRFFTIKKTKIGGVNRAFLVLNIQSSDPTTAITAGGGIYVDYQYIVKDDPENDLINAYTGTSSDNWGDAIDKLNNGEYINDL